MALPGLLPISSSARERLGGRKAGDGLEGPERKNRKEKERREGGGLVL